MAEVLAVSGSSAEADVKLGVRLSAALQRFKSASIAERNTLAWHLGDAFSEARRFTSLVKRLCAGETPESTRCAILDALEYAVLPHLISHVTELPKALHKLKRERPLRQLAVAGRRKPRS